MKAAAESMPSGVLTPSASGVQGALICILGTMIAAVLPILAFIFGLVALLSNSAFMLGLHVILGAMLGAALGAHDENVFMQQEAKCNQYQAASTGCLSCACASADNCTRAALTLGDCRGCTAYPLEYCNDFRSNRIIIGIIGAVTVFALAVPSVLSLLVLLRNEAARGIAGTKLEWVRARVEEQCKLLEGGLPLTFPLDALMGSIHRLEDSSDESNHALANRCKLDLAKAGFNVPAAPGTDEIKAGQAFTGAERGIVPDANDATPLMAWGNQPKVAAIPGRSSTPTNQVYPVVEPAYTPPPVVTSPNPILGGPGTVLATQLAPVADRSIVSENSIPEGGVETEGDTPTKERKHRHKHHKHKSEAVEEGVVAEAEGGDSGEKKRRHRKKREEEGADAV
ncbi:hypothetical protein ABBQ38_001850 [Trebouxia sp. C0009 RCD-2024]